MSTAAVLAVYVVGYVVTYRKAYLVVRADFDIPELPPDRADRVFASVLAMLLSFMWPLMWVGYGLYRTLTPITPREREADLDAREREIERLERELGIKHDE